jgi:predicted transposase YbfD/YdcC
VVLLQRKVADKQNEIPAAREGIRELDLRGKVVTLDALHTEREKAKLLLEQAADYVPVKADGDRRN